jgi:hypothetical protein
MRVVTVVALLFFGREAAHGQARGVRCLLLFAPTQEEKA